MVYFHLMLCIILISPERTNQKKEEGNGYSKIEQAAAAEAFKNYYKCLDTFNEKLRRDNNWREARLVQVGQSATLECGFCIRPDVGYEKYDIYWYRELLSEVSEGLVPFEDRRFVLGRTKSLTINDVMIADAGEYSCHLKGDIYFNTWQLDVATDEDRIMVRTSGKFRRPQNDTLLPDMNLMLTTAWTLWTACNQCNKMGYRRRIGICTVKKINNSEPVHPRDMPRLSTFTNGVPCRSTTVPDFIGDLPVIRNRKSETAIGLCFIPCPTTPAYTNVTDRYGRVIETVKAGHYSINQPKPKMPQLVKRKIQYGFKGKRATIQCPETYSEEQYIKWKNATRIINPAFVRRKTRGRVLIDSGNRIVIRRLRLRDEGIYSCWIKDRHAATVKLVVKEKLDLKGAPKHIILIGFSLAILTLVCVGWHAFKARKQKTAR